MIRKAHPVEVKGFSQLWLEFLIEHKEEGSETLPTGETMRFVRQLFHEYTSGFIGGVALVADIGGNDFAGGLLWGSRGMSPVDTTWGNTAFGWGTYVRPEYRGDGLGSQLVAEGLSQLTAQGFDTIVLTPLVGNDRSLKMLERAGFTPHQTLMTRRLD